MSSEEKRDSGTTPTTPTPTPSTTPGDENQTNVLLTFVQMLEQFITQLHTVFPECPKVLVLKQGFENNFSSEKTSEERQAMAVQYITGWHDTFTAHYVQVSEEDDFLFDNPDISFFTATDLYNKWTDDLHLETKAAIWEFLKNLCNLSNMYNIYNQVPSNMMNTIQAKAVNIAQSLENGGSLKNLNLQELAVDIMRDVDMNELQAFAMQLTNGGTDLRKIQTMCGSLMGMLGSQGLDMSNVMQQLNRQ